MLGASRGEGRGLIHSGGPHRPWVGDVHELQVVVVRMEPPVGVILCDETKARRQSGTNATERGGEPYVAPESPWTRRTQGPRCKQGWSHGPVTIPASSMKRTGSARMLKVRLRESSGTGVSSTAARDR